MSSPLNIKDAEVALIWAATELTKTWATKGDEAPEHIAGAFNTIHASITKNVRHLAQSLEESGS